MNFRTHFLFVFIDLPEAMCYIIFINNFSGEL